MEDIRAVELKCARGAPLSDVLRPSGAQDVPLKGPDAARVQPTVVGLRPDRDGAAVKEGVERARCIADGTSVKERVVNPTVHEM